MNDNLDDFLNSLGIEPTVPAVATSVDTQQLADAGPAPVSEEPQTLSNEDFDDILEEYGFNRPQDAQAEEIAEEESGEEEGTNVDYDENGGEGRDLDIEEDADWDRLIDNSSIVPVPSEDNNTTQEVMEFNPASVADFDFEVHFHMPDGDVVDVPILTEEEAARQAQELEATPHREPLVPLNSPTLLLDESTTRFSGAEWFNEIQKKSIILAGLGGIGSWTALQLARMVPATLVLYDDDTVETVNMAGQLYRRDDVGRSKAAAVSNILTDFTNMHNIYAVPERFTENTEAGDIMICGFDNMKARELFFASWYSHVISKPVEERKKCLFLDGRLSMTDLQVFCITGEDEDYMIQYNLKYLFSDSEAEHTVCSMKQTTYLACMIGSIIVNLFTNWCANLVEPVIPYDLPFFTEYDSQNMILKTEK